MTKGFNGRCIHQKFYGVSNLAWGGRRSFSFLCFFWFSCLMNLDGAPVLFLPLTGFHEGRLMDIPFHFFFRSVFYVYDLL